ncbi:MAG: hypothetical protein NC225_03425 [Clostridium sp.]|nr:hypothetical protein [Clostridium sp.]MCM1398517.1 hypothetical protein [Clostridium sp.]MCM1460239.1 hypothetical protein [Bacteroides sp.]
MKIMGKARYFVILGAMIFLTACGNEKKDMIAEDLKENVGQDASAGNAAQNTGPDAIPEHVSYTVEVGGNTTKVEAEVIADGYGKVPTLAAEKCTDKDEYVERYAKRLFDDGDFKNVKPYQVQSREELEAELQYYQEKYAGNTEYSENDNTWRIENRLDFYDDDNYVEYPEGTLVYETHLSSESDEGESNEDVFYDAYLRGMVDGRTWTLSYDEGYSYNNVMVEGQKIKTEWIPTIYAKCIDEEYYIANTSEVTETYLNNACKREDAEKEAQEFLHRLGFGEMELLHIVQNNQGMDEDKISTDGYTMVFGVKQGGAHLLYSAGSITTSMDTGVNSDIAVQPYVEVVVNSNGVYSLMIMGNYNDAEIMSGESTMLSFEQIDEIAKERMTEIMTEYPSSYFNIDCIEFGYVYITYDGLEYAAVPAWCYCNGGRNEKFRSAVITICALDGAVIYSGGSSMLSGSGAIPY